MASHEEFKMSFTDVLPGIKTLSRSDKIRLIQFIACELEKDESSLIDANRSYPIWSPDTAFSAAAELLRALEEEKVAHE